MGHFLGEQKSWRDGAGSAILLRLHPVPGADPSFGGWGWGQAKRVPWGRTASQTQRGLWVSTGGPGRKPQHKTLWSHDGSHLPGYRGELLSFVLCLGTSLYLPAVLTFSLGSPGGLVLPAAGPTGPPPTHYFLLPPGLPDCSPAGASPPALSTAAAQTAARPPAVPSTVVPGWVPAELTLVAGAGGQGAEDRNAGGAPGLFPVSTAVCLWWAVGGARGRNGQCW